MTPEEASIGSACWSCVPDKWAALLFLAANGGTGGGGSGTGAVVCQSGAPVAAPSSGCGISLDTDTGALYIYINGAWILKV